MSVNYILKDLGPDHLATAFVRDQVDAFITSGIKPRPWHYSGLHNPWGQSAPHYDSWGFLDLCHADDLVEPMKQVIGPDIILFDSQLWPDPLAGPDRADGFPVSPRAGASLFLGIAQDEGRAPKLTLPGQSDDPVPLTAGRLAIVDMALSYKFDLAKTSPDPLVFMARYFPATSRYIRDPGAPEHRELTDRYPLINFAKLPLWQVAGEDRAGNDFVTGFNSTAAHWSDARQ